MILLIQKNRAIFFLNWMHSQNFQKIDLAKTCINFLFLSWNTTRLFVHSFILLFWQFFWVDLTENQALLCPQRKPWKIFLVLKWLGAFIFSIPTYPCNLFSPLLRNKKKSVPMSELPEEAQRQKRAAWRAASRRYYARKIARQQANPSRSGPLPHITDPRYSQAISLVDKRRRTLISELPEESQTLQREAWRAASRRYYARKMARHTEQPTQYAHLLQNTEPSEETLAASSGGIMCSWWTVMLLSFSVPHT